MSLPNNYPSTEEHDRALAIESLQYFMKYELTGDYIEDNLQQMPHEDCISLALHIVAKEYIQVGHIIRRFLAREKWAELLHDFHLDTDDEANKFKEEWVL